MLMQTTKKVTIMATSVVEIEGKRWFWKITMQQ